MKAVKQKLPLFFLICISLFWSVYYQTNNKFNDFGAANYEWLFMLDALLVLPLLCLLCIKNKKQAAIKALVMICLAVMIGSYIIPESSKFIWHYLESGRYLILALFLLFEITAIVTVFLAIKVALNQGEDPDEAVSQPIQKWLGEGLVGKVLEFEARVWAYALFAKNISAAQFKGEQHFSYHNKDGAQSNSLSFVILILIELPLVHVLVHFIWSPMAALVLTLLTLFTLLLFIADYKAMSRRPISINHEKLIVRNGVFAPLEITLHQIDQIETNQVYIPRNKYCKRYNYSGIPNIVITLNQPIGSVKDVYLGVDNPTAFIEAVNQIKQVDAD